MMNETKNYQVLSGSALKVIAMISMLIDHTAAFVLSRYQWAKTPFFVVGSHSLSIYRMMRIMGRIAFPIFCFLLVEGFIHTSNRKRYGINLLIFALISEVPWNLIHSGRFLYKGQNVFFTLFLGYIGLCIIEKYKDSRKKQLIGLLIGLLAAILMHADYGVSGYGFIIMLYALKDNKIIRAIVGSCFLSNPYYAGIAFIPIALYNGERGFIKGKLSKYAFYAFYPVHMFILYAIRTVLIMG